MPKAIAARTPKIPMIIPAMEAGCRKSEPAPLLLSGMKEAGVAALSVVARVVVLELLVSAGMVVGAPKDVTPKDGTSEDD